MNLIKLLARDTCVFRSEARSHATARGGETISMTIMPATFILAPHSLPSRRAWLHFVASLREIMAAY